MQPFDSPDWWPPLFSRSSAGRSAGASRRSRPLCCFPSLWDVLPLPLSAAVHPMSSSHQGSPPSPASTVNAWFCVSTESRPTTSDPFCCLWSLCWGANPVQERQEQLSQPGATELALR